MNYYKMEDRSLPIASEMHNNKNISLVSTSTLTEQVISNASANGLLITDSAFIQVTLKNDPQTVEQIKALENKNITAVFTSLNAITAVTNQLALRPDWKVYCMDGVSKPAAINFFGEAAIMDTASTAKQLAEKIIEHADTTKIIFFCGNKRLTDLPETLKKASIEIEEVEVYTTIKTPHKIENTLYDAIAFFSPSAVESFFENNILLPNIIAFTVGQTTANRINQFCNNKVIISQKPGKENLIKTVIDYFNTTQI